MAAPIPPPPGSAAPGELYVDLQSRTLWLGVTAAVDPNLAVLISDIVGESEDDAAILASANAYADTQVATRAPMVHTHTSGQITDFDAAVDARIVASPAGGGAWERGMVVMWSGLLSAIGVGNLAGWALCDGGNGTPNLRDKFIIGAGNKAVGAVNSLTQLPTNPDGSHTHIASGTAVTEGQLPAHKHTLTGVTGVESADHTHTVNLTAASAGAHTHGPGTGSAFAVAQSSSTNRVSYQEGAGLFMNSTALTTPNGAHTHTVAGNTGGKSGTHTHTLTGETANTGLGETHTHAIQSSGVHTHNITQNNLRETIPYYALAYIMKL